MLPKINGKKLITLISGATKGSYKNNVTALFNKYYVPSFVLCAGFCLVWYNHYYNKAFDTQTLLLSVCNILTLAIAITLFYQLANLKRNYQSATERAQYSEIKLDKIYGSEMIGLLFTNLDGKVLHANKAFLDIIGYTKEDLDNGLISWHSLTPEEFGEATVNAVEQLKVNTYCTPFEKEYIRKDGTRVSILIGASLLSDSDLGEAVTYIIDLTDKKESEKREQILTRQLTQQKEELVRIFMNAPAMVCIRRGPDLHIEFANKAAQAFSKTVNPASLTTKEAAEKIKLNQSSALAEQVYRSGVPFAGKSYPLRFDRDGTGVFEDGWFDLIFEPLYDVDGNIDGVVSFAFDVTGLVQANKELQENESKFQFLTDAIPHKIWTSNPDGKATYYNKGWYDYTGTTTYEELHSVIWNIIHPDDLKKASESWSAAMKTGEDMELEQRFRRHDGVYQWHLTRFCAHKDKNGRVETWFGTSTNIHDQKTAQESLKVSEAHFKALTNNKALLIWQINPACTTTYVNDTWREYTGVTAQEITEEHWVSNIHPEDRARALEEFNSAFDLQLPIHSKYRFKDSRTGEYRWMLDNAHPVFNPDFNGYIGSMTDIHEQVTAQRAAELLLQRKDDFLGIASHELKTPITSMKASLQLLQRYGTDEINSEKSKVLIDRANRQANKLTAIVNDLLDVTKIQSGKMQLNKVSYDFMQSLQECVYEMQQYGPKHQMIIEGDHPPLITADRERIEQVLINLLSNAIKYSPGKEVILISLQADKQQLKCSISDSGIGIPQDKQPFIFDRFFRVHNSSQTFAGLGLGLFISSEIVKQHKGTIGMLSEEGMGSTFWFTLPLS